MAVAVLAGGRGDTTAADVPRRPRQIPTRAPERPIAGRQPPYCIEVIIAASLPPRLQGVRHFTQKGMDNGDDFFFYSSDDSSSDDEDLVVVALVVHDHIERQLPRYRGSLTGHAPNLNRNRERGHTLLYADYFVNTLLFKPDKFRCRFRMARHLFNHIREGVISHDPYSSAKRMPLASLDSPLIRNAPRPSACLHMKFQAIWWMSTCA